MDIQWYRNFLIVAEEGNITRASERIHITQPALSRQMMDLEEEYHTQLMVRGKRQVTLTESGVILQQRIKVMLSLLDGAKEEIADANDLSGGVVRLGCVETVVSKALPHLFTEFSRRHPKVCYELYNADGDDIRSKLDQGLLDFGILLSPVEAAKYDALPLPYFEQWGLVTRTDTPLAKKGFVTKEDLSDLPLIVPRRTIVKEEIASWLGIDSDRLNIKMCHNLLSNTLPLIASGFADAISVKGAFVGHNQENLVFLLFSPERKTSHVLAWKKNRHLDHAASLFLEYLKAL